MDHLGASGAGFSVESADSYAVSSTADNSSGNVLNLTYHDLHREFVMDVDAKQARQRKHVVEFWLEYCGLDEDSLIGDEMLVDFDAQLNRFRDKLAKIKSRKTAANFASELRSARALYLRLLFEDELPTSFVDAIQLGLKRKGMKAHDLRIDLCETAYHWALGNTTPKRNSSLALVHQLEEHLGFAKNSLAVRAHKKPSKVHDISKDVPWRRYLAVVKKHACRLLPENMPEKLRQDIDAWVEHKQKAEHFLPNGEVVYLEPRLRWNSDETVKMRRESLYAYYGFLSRPTAPKQESLLGWEERLDFGLGIPVENLRFTMLLNRDYLYAYVKYGELRSFDKAAFEQFEKSRQGKPSSTAKGPQKTISQSYQAFVVAANNLVNKPYSFFRLHPEYAEEAGVSAEKWSEWLDARHKDTLAVATISRNKVGLNKRSNKELISEMLRDENPMQIMFDVLEQLRRDKPPATSPVWLACHARDVAIISLLAFDPLRAKNIHEMDLNKQLVKNKKTDRWAIEIEAHEFKNAIFGHAERRYRVLPEDVDQDMRNWLSVRDSVSGADQTSAVFTRVAKRQPKGSKQPVITDTARLSRTSLYSILDKHTRAYLGLSLGTHFFRTLLATTVAKHGTPTQVKAILNDSEEIAMKVYRDVRNEDEFKALDDIYAATRPKKGRGQ